jgi:superfamily II DNA or RNA helicase
MTWTLQFQDGTLLVEGADLSDLPSGFRWDERVGKPRGPADLYGQVIYRAIERQIPYVDDASAWEPLSLSQGVEREPRVYQTEAVNAWIQNKRRGIVCLPTGAGKTFVAEMCIARTKRPTLVVAPTLDLVGQWYDRLKTAFQQEVGILGGGHHEVLPLTVSTYDSAHLYLAQYGMRFCCLIFDEVHHLPAPAYLQSTRHSLAPFRLGLTATLEREDGRESLLNDAVGPVVYRKEITELSGVFLADYETETIMVPLTEEERSQYDAYRKSYTDFLEAKKIDMRSGGWNAFIRAAASSRAGRAAFQGHREAKMIAQGAQGKIEIVDRLLQRHKGQRALIFTNDNLTAYRISRLFLIPCITHQTKIKERRGLIDQFTSGELKVLVTSRVLNEGVDLPSAEVAIVMSGTGTVREHVQRLGRILRPSEGKRAVLYELVAQDTAEEFTSKRRRRHDAYK